MKKTLLVSLVLSLGCLMVSQKVAAQGTVYLSNLSEPSEFYTYTISSNGASAQRFVTGSSPGYLLSSVELSMGAAVGTPTGFSVFLYGASRSGEPETVPLASLSGPAPISAGNYSFTNSGITLSPLTPYFVVARATSSSESGSYRWHISQSTAYTSSDSWEMSLDRYVSDPGGFNWSAVGNTPLQFAINATAIPEPSSLVFSLAGGIITANRLLRRRNT